MKALIVLPLIVFSIIGFVLLFFAINLQWEVTFLGWLTIALFAFFPLLVVYGIVFGFSVSEKQQKRMEERQNSLSGNEKGMTIEMPLFDKRCFIEWTSIEAVVYYNHIFGSDFTTYHQGFKVYLNTPPRYTKYEKQWWLNRLIDRDSHLMMIDVTDGTLGYKEIPLMLEKYLSTIEKWNPYSKEQNIIIYNRSNKSMEDLKKGAP